ncbi:MAG: peptide ABC transporter substrate-binding protein [Dehalococcoidia bacterium]|nr:peptide ABC transporter substrate-binding protein [Dehalococcoidia bacterium]MYA61880.1 peptide ABC transporter substrate-binding protein [Dehalococcoidia bacterium]
MKKIAILATILALAFVLACGDSETEEPVSVAEEVAKSAEPTAAPEPTTAPEPAAAQQPQPAPTTAPAVSGMEEGSESGESGGVFRRLWSDPPTLDPHLTTDTTSSGVVVELFSGLVTMNTDLQLVPDIAESWDIDDTGTVYTFNLRKNAKFHDGKPITAHDVKWSLERAVHPDTASPVADTYLNDIIGVEKALEGETTEIEGVRVIDDHTIEFTIDAPKAYFLAKLTYPTAFVLDRENVEAGGRNWTENPNGTGPFKLAEYRIGERIILERNENFYRQPAHVDSISMNLAGGQAMAMYENDEIDITGVGLFDLDRVLDPNEDLNKELIIAPPDFSVSYVGFNTSMPPFDDPKFRQALNHAVDKELIATEVLSELVEPAYGILPPGFPGYNENLVGLEYDPEFARQLLAESKYADPDTRPRIEVTVPGTGGTIGLDLEVIIEMWRQELGVEVEIQQVEWATYLEDLNQQRFQAYGGLGWQADYPDPQDFLDILFHTESSINHGAYSNAELDAILEEARTEADLEKRVSLYHQAEKMIVDDAAWLPLWYAGERYVLIKPHVENYRVTPMIIPKLKEIRITDG